MTRYIRLRAAVLAALTCALAVTGFAAPTAEGAAALPEELNFSDQKAFAFHDTHVSVDEVPIPGAEKTEEVQEVGSVSNGNGDIAEVTLKGGKLSIESVESPGKYSGTVNLVPIDPATPKTKVFFAVRDNWGWAAIVLIAGLLLALLSELWLTRWRPRGQLKKAFVRLGERLTATAAQQTEKLTEARQGWVALRIHGPGSMLTHFKERIESGLTNATSDAERERFGPGGEEMKKVETALETYEELLGYCGQIAQAYKSLVARLELEAIGAKFASGALAERIGELLKSRTPIAGAAELTETLTEAKDVYLVLHGVSRLDLSYRLLAEKPDVSADVKSKIGMRREQLLHNDASTDDLTAQRTIYGEIAKGLYEVAAPKAVEVTLPLLASFGLGGAAPPPAAPAVSPPAPLIPAAAPVVSTGAEKEANAWSKYLDMGNWAFTVISGVVVFLAGLSALYFNNATFGSVGDYLGMLLWGSTVQGGISLVRQVVPGTAKGLVSGGT